MDFHKEQLFNIDAGGLDLRAISPFENMRIDNLCEAKFKALKALHINESTRKLGIAPEDSLFLLTVKNPAQYSTSRIHKIGCRFEQTLYYTKYDALDNIMFCPVGQINFFTASVPRNVSQFLDTLALGYDEIINDYSELFFGLNKKSIRKTNQLVFIEEIFIKEECRKNNLGELLINIMLRECTLKSPQGLAPSILLYMDENRDLDLLKKFYNKVLHEDYEISFFGQHTACAQFTPKNTSLSRF